jgi:hypothetical protein
MLKLVWMTWLLSQASYLFVGHTKVQTRGANTPINIRDVSWYNLNTSFIFRREKLRSVRLDSRRVLRSTVQVTGSLTAQVRTVNTD